MQGTCFGFITVTRGTAGTSYLVTVLPTVVQPPDKVLMGNAVRHPQGNSREGSQPADSLCNSLPLPFTPASGMVSPGKANPGHGPPPHPNGQRGPGDTTRGTSSRCAPSRGSRGCRFTVGSSPASNSRPPPGLARAPGLAKDRGGPTYISLRWPAGVSPNTGCRTKAACPLMRPPHTPTQNKTANGPSPQYRHLPAGRPGLRGRRWRLSGCEASIALGYDG